MKLTHRESEKAESKYHQILRNAVRNIETQKRGLPNFMGMQSKLTKTFGEDQTKCLQGVASNEISPA